MTLCKHAFEHVDADTLKLFRVSFPSDDDLDATLRHFLPKHNPDNGVEYLSRPVKRLEGLFGNPIDEHVHAIVQRPPAGEFGQPHVPNLSHCRFQHPMPLIRITPTPCDR